jgi:Histidine kinase-, DNA gyrase B-, and HSP90-like ATPase
VTLTVENTGEKLSAQLVSTLTEPFQRGTERVRTDHAGIGLGLAIVKSITQAHDGTLTITPRTGGGLHVTVQLPATPTHTGRLNRPGFDAASEKPRATGSERSGVPVATGRTDRKSAPPRTTASPSAQVS